MSKPICKRCLLNEITEGDYFKTVYEYIEQLPVEQKVDDACYQKRLAICKNCDNLVNGMCRLCGCFVETRAIKKKMSCPTGNKWR